MMIKNVVGVVACCSQTEFRLLENCIPLQDVANQMLIYINLLQLNVLFSYFKILTELKSLNLERSIKA